MKVSRGKEVGKLCSVCLISLASVVLPFFFLFFLQSWGRISNKNFLFQSYSCTAAATIARCAILKLPVCCNRNARIFLSACGCVCLLAKFKLFCPRHFLDSATKLEPGVYFFLHSAHLTTPTGSKKIKVIARDTTHLLSATKLQ